MDRKIAIITFVCLLGCLAIPSEKPRPHRKRPHHRILIVNGTESPRGSHPHMVALTLGPERSYVCGGSLLSKRTVLTAAHCIEAVYMDGALDETLAIIVGTNRWSTGGHTYPIDRNITYPHYDATTFKNDLGLLFTTSDVVLNDDVQPIVLTFDDIPGDVQAKVTGWGSDGENESSPEKLQEVRLSTISGQKCVDDVRQAAEELGLSYSSVDPQVELCTYTARGLGTCSGDSGSPLARISDGRQIGIVSWGFPCARGAPDMFTRISSFAEWLRENMI